MKLETSQDLLNRVRAEHDSSWYGLAKLFGAHINTIYSWKGGHTSVDRKFAPRIAELLKESPEYVLACLEAEREQHAEVLKVWHRIAAKFRSHTASVLFMALGLMTVPRESAAAVLEVDLSQELSNQHVIHYAQFMAGMLRRSIGAQISVNITVNIPASGAHIHRDAPSDGTAPGNRLRPPQSDVR